MACGIGVGGAEQRCHFGGCFLFVTVVLLQKLQAQLKVLGLRLRRLLRG
jgi:hypothetical protein